MQFAILNINRKIKREYKLSGSERCFECVFCESETDSIRLLIRNGFFKLFPPKEKKKIDEF